MVGIGQFGFRGHQIFQKGLIAALAVFAALALCLLPSVAPDYATARRISAAGSPYCVSSPGAVSTASVAPRHIAALGLSPGLSNAVASADGAAAAIVLETSTGRVLYSANAYAPLPMASTTKVLTAITVLQHLPLDARVTVCPQAQGVEGSSVYLRAGEVWTVRDLLYGLMLRSGNDCAVQLAISTAGSVQAFATMMNDTAVAAGATHSHFVNPHGLHDPHHYTTAYDLARITAYALRNREFARIVSTRAYTYTHPTRGQQTFVNKNKMLAGYAGANGVKTGYTQVAGRCLVSSARRDGMQLVCVVLHCYTMWQTSAELMDAAFATYPMRCLWQAGQPVVLAGAGPTPVTVPYDLAYPLSGAECARLCYRYVPTASGTGLGTVEVHMDGHTLVSAPLCPA